MYLILVMAINISVILFIYTITGSDFQVKKSRNFEIVIVVAILKNMYMERTHSVCSSLRFVLENCISNVC